MNRADRRKDLKVFKMSQRIAKAHYQYDHEGRLIVLIPPNGLLKDGDIFTSDLYPDQEFRAKINSI